ncbi:MAG: asparagine synthase-related protein, partial [Planctomycetota bacterium]
RQHVTVALSGDGGDELFAGYERYRALWLSQFVSRYFPIHRLPGSSLIKRLPESSARSSTLRKIKRFFEAMGQTPDRRFMNWLQIFPERMRASLYNDSMIESLPDEDPFAFFQNAWASVRDRDLVTRASMADLQTYLTCDLMTKVDIASMAHSLEVRQPMLDYRVIELAMAMPLQHKFKHPWMPRTPLSTGWRGKAILKSAFPSAIPESIWNRGKMGFGIPIARWFRAQLRDMLHDLLLGDDARSTEYFRLDSLREMVHQHDSGRVNHAYRLWNLLFLEKWLRANT